MLMKQIQRLYANSDRKYFEVFKFKSQKTFYSMFTYLNCAYCVTTFTWPLGLSSSSSRRTSSQALHPANIQNLRSAATSPVHLSISFAVKIRQQMVHGQNRTVCPVPVICAIENLNFIIKLRHASL